MSGKLFKSTMLKSESVDSEPETLRMTINDLGTKKPKLFRRSVTVPAEITSGTMRNDPDIIMDMDVYEMVIAEVFYVYFY